jgi:osmotically-inducible protein OsmY
MTNDELRGSVSDELHWDPKIDNDAIAVSAADGVVTLRGTVGSLRQKREAKKAAERVYGVARVENQLRVRSGGTSVKRPTLSRPTFAASPRS